jgi:electron transport complex protein RnfD
MLRDEPLPAAGGSKVKAVLLPNAGGYSTAAFEKPQTSLRLPTAARMLLVAIAAALAVLQSASGDGGASLYLAIFCLAAALVCELLVGLGKRRVSILDGSAAASALILALMLPSALPPYLAAAGAAFAVLVAKASYGGLGANPFNPALCGWFFVRFLRPAVFAGTLSSSPLVMLADRSASSMPTARASLRELLTQGANWGGGYLSAVLERAPAFLRAPAAYLDFFTSPGTGIAGDRGFLSLLAASAFLFIAGALRPAGPALYIVCYLTLVRFAGGLPFGEGLWAGDMLFALGTGGTAVAAFLLLGDGPSNPSSTAGRLAAAVIAALLTFFFRYMKSEPYGAFYAVAALNLLTPAIRLAESRLLYGSPQQAAKRLDMEVSDGR